MSLLPEITGSQKLIHVAFIPLARDLNCDVLGDSLWDLPSQSDFTFH